MKIVKVDGYRDRHTIETFESFLNLPNMTEQHANNVCGVINSGLSDRSLLSWKVVPNDYILEQNTLS